MTSSPSASRRVVIQNPKGLHMRPAPRFVKQAGGFRSDVRALCNGREVDGKSILDMTTLAAECGMTLEIRAEGPTPRRPSTRSPGWSRPDSTWTTTATTTRWAMAESQTGDLSGRWAGEYYLHDRPHPVSAELVQEGETGALAGSMTDDETDRSASVFEAANEAGLPPGADEKIEARLHELLPDPPEAPIRYVSHLPHDSELAGRVEGRKVEFLKTYQGTAFGGYQVGDRLVGHRTEHHSVHYRGTLSPDGNTIEGRWWVDANPEIGSAPFRRVVHPPSAGLEDQNEENHPQMTPMKSDPNGRASRFSERVGLSSSAHDGFRGGLFFSPGRGGR